MSELATPFLPVSSLTPGVAKTGRDRSYLVELLRTLIRVTQAAVPAFFLFSAPAAAQITYPAIPEGSERYGIEGHPDITSGNHFYHTWCCSLKDCRPLKPGSVTITDRGYLVPLPDGRKELVPFDDKQRIKSAPPESVGTEFGQTDHGCYHKEAGEWRVRCFYPRGGFF